MWWVKPAPVPAPLVTAGTLAIPFSGALGIPGTTILRGTEDFDYGAFSGARMNMGTWLDTDRGLGIEAGGFILERQSLGSSYFATGTGDSILAIPFFNTQLGVEDFADYSAPFGTAGRIDIASSIRFWGAEGNVLLGGPTGSNLTVTFLAGFRHLNLHETFAISGGSTAIFDTTFAPPALGSVPFLGEEIGPPATITTLDHYTTRNHFYGGQVGARAAYILGGASVLVTGKVALGATHQLLNVSGRSDLLVGIVPFETTPGGLFAQPSNSGRFSDCEFSVVPEVEVKLGYQLTNALSLFVGYNFLYWSGVARASEQFNRNVNPAQVPTFFDFGAVGKAPPASPVHNTSDFWVHGLSFGMGLVF